MEANEYPVVDGAPFRVFFLALNAELVEIFLHFVIVFLGEIALTTFER